MRRDAARTAHALPMHDEVLAESSPIGGDATHGNRRTHRRGYTGMIAAMHRIGWPRPLAMALALAGIAVLADGGWIVAKAQLGQWLLQRAWQRSQVTGAAVKPWPWADMHPVARIYAPAQRADVIALSGATGRTLAWGPGHLDGSAIAGESGNAVFTAHRDTHFAFLANLRIGERIVVENADGSRAQFRVSGTSIVAASALHLRAETAVPMLTLVTCYPFDAVAPGTPWRYVVTATLAAPPVMASAADRVSRWSPS